MQELWVSLSGANALQRKVETLANNVANANTPGFKKDQLVFKEFINEYHKPAEAIDLPRKEWAPEDYYRTLGAEHAFVKIDGSYTDHFQGTLVPSNNPLDVAIQGVGFFEIQTPNGIRYTRKGNFTLNKDQQLSTENGHLILGALAKDATTQNNPVVREPIVINKFPVFISQDGSVFSQGNKIGQLSIVEFNDSQALKKEGNSLYANEDINNIKNEFNESRIYQGFIEGSNVNAVSEISELIKANRQFESIMKVIKTIDGISQKSVNDITKF